MGAVTGRGKVRGGGRRPPLAPPCGAAQGIRAPPPTARTRAEEGRESPASPQEFARQVGGPGPATGDRDFGAGGALRCRIRWPPQDNGTVLHPHQFIYFDADSSSSCDDQSSARYCRDRRRIELPVSLSGSVHSGLFSTSRDPLRQRTAERANC